MACMTGLEPNNNHSMKKNVSIVVAAQAVVLLASVAKSLVIPKVLGIEDFAYWQIYVLYSGFVGVFSCGFSDGIYLVYGGKAYAELPKERLRRLIRINIAILIIFASSICALTYFESDPMRRLALLFVGMDIVPVCISGLLIYVLQITNRFGAYGFYSIIDKVAMLFIIIVIVAASLPSSSSFIVADCATKWLAMLLVAAKCRDLIFGPAIRIGIGLKDYLSISKVGLSLLLANLAGMLITNLGRFFVELFGDLSSYAYYSLGVSITNLVLTFVTAVSLVVYPSLKRLPVQELSEYFLRIRSIVTIVSLAGLSLYAAAYLFVCAVFPDYVPLLAYLNFLFLAVVGQMKMQLLNNTYYKAMRLEKRLLLVNLEGVALFLAFGGVAFFVTRDVMSIAVATAAVMLVRAWISEKELSDALGLRSQNILKEALFLALFAFVTLFAAPESLVAATILSMSCLIVFLIRYKRGSGLI